MLLYIILSAVTTIYLIRSSIMDIKERKVYIFPAMAFTIIWIIYAIFKGVNFKITALFIGTVIVTAALMSIFRAWGGGDSFILVLFAAIYVSAIGIRQYTDIIGFLLMFAAGLIISAFIGIAECKIQKQKNVMKYTAAVVPGLALVCVIAEIIGAVMNF